MNTRRIWIEIVVVGSAISIGLALLLASIGAAAGIPEAGSDALQAAPAASQKAAPAEQVFDGMVTCSRCGAKHSPALQRLVSAESSYVLQGDSQVLKPFAGERARIVGSLSGRTIQVRSVSPPS